MFGKQLSAYYERFMAFLQYALVRTGVYHTCLLTQAYTQEMLQASAAASAPAQRTCTAHLHRQGRDYVKTSPSSAVMTNGSGGGNSHHDLDSDLSDRVVLDAGVHAQV